jgi:GT2 family glycosyltransferase/SAM-dependent methyltransferase
MTFASMLAGLGYTLDNQNQVWRRPSYKGIAYNDGDEIETRIGAAIEGAQDISVLSPELRRHCIDWPSLYHLTGSRANLMRPFAQYFTESSTVLEIGAGCGAITRYMGECGAQVLALEGTPRRASIARSRTRNLPNVTVLSERFNDFAPGIQFDVITLIGVLEYANLFTPSDDPHLTMLARVRQLLKPDGLLIIAIENQLGLKYFAGALEDHLGQPMYGVEGRYQPNQAQTFGFKAIKALLHEAGFAQQQFMSPLPDYKLPSSIVTQSGLANATFDSSAFAWQGARSDPQLPQLTNFALELAWPEIDKNGLALDMANSFLIAAKSTAGQQIIDPSILAFHYSANRLPQFCKQTLFVQKGNDIELHVSHMLESPDVTVQGEVLNQHIGQSVQPYVQGEPLSKRFVKLVTQDNWSSAQLQEYLQTWLAALQKHINHLGSHLDLEQATLNTLLPGGCIDCVAQNIIMREGQAFENIDQEWTCVHPVVFGHLIFRQAWMLLQSVSCFSPCKDAHPMTREAFIHLVFKLLNLEVSESDISNYGLLEAAIQKSVGTTHTNHIDWQLQTSLNYQRVNHHNALLVAQRDIQIFHLNAQVASQEFTINHLQNDLHHVQRLNHEIHTRLQGTSAENAQLGIQLNEIRNSISWRITKPMRKALGLLPLSFRSSLRTFISSTFGRAFRSSKAIVKNSFFSNTSSNYLSSKLNAVRVEIQKNTSQFNSSMNEAALQSIVKERYIYSGNRFLNSDIRPDINATTPIDISLVTFNSAKWLLQFFNSIEELNYSLSQIKIFVLDNGSTDDTVLLLKNFQIKMKTVGIEMHINQGPNIGFGAGHNVNCKLGHSPLILISNVDLRFDSSSLTEAVSHANEDDISVAAWEFRQKPYEHPKYYDPVTGFTNWNSHACVLLRRDSFEAVGGYDENIFMYGEDVDLSYNLRANGFLIKYVPKAVVWHETYTGADQVKPLQYAGSTFASQYLRIKYGKIKDILAIPALQRILLNSPEPFNGAKDAVRANGKKLWLKAYSGFTKRIQTNAAFPFRAFDYDLTRMGAFYKLGDLPVDGPLVSVITRTYAGRATYLQQAIISVSKQTYPNIEHIVAEDGGTTHETLCRQAKLNINPRLKYMSLDKVGRCVTGNSALAIANGRYCLFLDDDDLLFADHVEVLLSALLKAPDAVAAYSPAMEIATNVLDKYTGEYIETQYLTPEGLQQEYSYEKLRQHNYIAIQSILFERQLFLERGGFDTGLNYLEDWNLWVRYAWNNTFIFVPKLTSIYRVPASESEFKIRENLLKNAYETACKANSDALELLQS